MQFLRDIWYMAAWVEELDEAPFLTRRILGRPIVMVRDSDGKARAFDDRCPHRSAPLSRGTFDGNRLACGYHGLQFDMTGQCVHSPHPSGKIPRGLVVKSYPVEVRHQAIWIWMGDKQADPDLIPDFGTLDEAGVTRHDHLIMPVPFELIVDNLLDCSHTSFLHEGSLGNFEMTAAPTQVRQSGNRINVIRYNHNVPPPAMFDLLFRQDGAPVDTWTDFRWDAPSCLLLDVGVTTPGGTREQGTGYYGIHIVTPETETSSHYFTAAARWNIRSDLDTEEARIRISDLRRFAFEEQDKPMIAAQFANLLAFPEAETKPVMIETDLGAVKWRKIVQNMIAAETIVA